MAIPLCLSQQARPSAFEPSNEDGPLGGCAPGVVSDQPSQFPRGGLAACDPVGMPEPPQLGRRGVAENPFPGAARPCTTR
eukprot:12415427-Alexandrium_andersonii.AAC.1